MLRSCYWVVLRSDSGGPPLHRAARSRRDRRCHSPSVGSDRDADDWGRRRVTDEATERRIADLEEKVEHLLEQADEREAFMGQVVTALASASVALESVCHPRMTGTDG